MLGPGHPPPTRSLRVPPIHGPTDRDGRGDAMTRADEPHPPRAPDTARAFAPAPHHLVGIGVLGLLVVAAVAGAFGATEGTAVAETASLRLTVAFPERTRAKLDHTVSVEVANHGSADLPRLVLRFDRRYLDGFTAVAFTPDVARLSRDAYLIELDDVAAGETRLVTVALRAAAHWAQAGFVEAVAPDEVARAEFRSFVFP
jgi:hypothetical protein